MVQVVVAIAPSLFQKGLELVEPIPCCVGESRWPLRRQKWWPPVADGVDVARRAHNDRAAPIRRRKPSLALDADIIITVPEHPEMMWQSNSLYIAGREISWSRVSEPPHIPQVFPKGWVFIFALSCVNMSGRDKTSRA